MDETENTDASKLQETLEAGIHERLKYILQDDSLEVEIHASSGGKKLKNQNQVEKTLRPWYNGQCAAAKPKLRKV